MFIFFASESAEAFTPADLTTLFWFDANDPATLTLSGSEVTTWADKSTNSTNLTRIGSENGPDNTGTLNSKTTLAFNLEGLEFAAEKTNVRSLFIVFNNAGGQTGNADLTLLFGGTGFLSRTTINEPATYDIYTAINGTNNYQFGLNGADLITINDNESKDLGRTYLENKGPNLWYYQFQADSDCQLKYLSGYATTRGKLDVAEFIAFSTELSESDKQKVEGYLAHKWALTDQLPSGHPYKTTAPTV